MIIIITPKDSHSREVNSLCIWAVTEALQACLCALHAPTPDTTHQVQPELHPRPFNAFISLFSLCSSCLHGIPTFKLTAPWPANAGSLYCGLFVYSFTSLPVFSLSSHVLGISLGLLHKPRGLCSLQSSLPVPFQSREMRWGVIDSDSVRSVNPEVSTQVMLAW